MQRNFWTMGDFANLNNFIEHEEKNYLKEDFDNDEQRLCAVKGLVCVSGTNPQLTSLRTNNNSTEDFIQAIVSNFSDPWALNKQTVLELSKLKRPHNDWSHLNNVARIQALKRKLPLEDQERLFDIT